VTALSGPAVPRLVGAAFVFQFTTSLSAGLLTTSSLSGDIGTVLATTGADATKMRVFVVLELFTAVGIIALTSLLLVALRDTIPSVATVAFALWLAEATLLAVSMLGITALVDLGSASIGTGSGVSPSDAAVGTFALGLQENARNIDMLFFGAGAVLWYSLFVRTRFVPRWLGIWGLVSVVLVLVATLVLVWDHHQQPPLVLYAPYVPFELVVGVWLLVKGSPGWPTTAGGPAGP